jgi:hypothetical protein
VVSCGTADVESLTGQSATKHQGYDLDRSGQANPRRVRDMNKKNKVSLLAISYFESLPFV